MKNENGWTSDKVSRRQLIAEDYRILLLIGDQLGDFIPLEEATVNIDSRKAISKKYKRYVGQEVVYDHESNLWEMGGLNI